MAIAFDATSNGGTTGTSLTFSHTTSGTNRLLMVYTFFDNDTITGVTYNSVSMTKLDQIDFTTNRIAAWILVDPASGANDIVVSSSSSTPINAQGVSYTGCAQSGQPDAQGSAGGTSQSSPIDLTITVATTNSWLVGGVRVNGTGNSSAGTDTTQRLSANGIQSYDSNAALATGSQTIQATFTSPNDAGFVGASIAPAAEDVSVTPISNLALLGVG